jgi:hypothetical protein
MLEEAVAEEKAKMWRYDFFPGLLVMYNPQRSPLGSYGECFAVWGTT